MKVALATHSLRGYPPRDGQWPTREIRRNLFAWMRRQGFDGVEVGSWWFDFFSAPISEIQELPAEMAEHGLELAGLNCLRKNVTHPAVADQNRRDLRRTIAVAEVLRPRIVNISLSLAGSVVGVSEERVKGLPTSPGASGGASAEEFAEAGAFLGDLAREADRAGLELALELHHCSLADTSRGLLRLLDLADQPNLGATLDLGNLYWAHDVPEEQWYEAVVALAPRVKLWHLKNVQRVFVPETRHAFFTHAALGEGDIDYRWALDRLVAAGFDGYLSIEGAGPGDLLAFASRSKAYLDELLADLRAGHSLAVQ